MITGHSMSQNENLNQARDPHDQDHLRGAPPARLELHVSTTMPSMPAKKTKTKNKILEDRYYGSTAHDQCPGSILNSNRPVPWVNAQQVQRPSHSSGFTRRQSNTGHLIATRLANVVAMALQ